jgi:hypothetical protein
MGTTLTGTTPQDTYDSLIKVTDNGPLSGSLKTLTDGLGNDSALALSTGAASITGTLAVTGATTLSSSISATQGSFALATVGGSIGSVKNLTVTNTNGAVGDFAGLNFAYYNSGTNFGYIGSILTTEATNGASDLVFGTKANSAATAVTEYMRLQAGGNVGIGTEAPTQKLSVVGGSIFTSRTDSSENIIISDGTVNSSIQQVTHLYLNSGGNSATFGDVVFRTKNSFTEMARFTQNGLCFNGDTAAANALDDYEEGTFTPTMAGATFVYTGQSGFYTKIGRQVSIFMDVDATYSSATGVFSVNLPFTVLTNSRGEGVVRPITGVTFTNYVTCEAVGTSLFFENCFTSTGSASTDMDSTNFNSAGFRFFASFTYFV